MQVWPGHRYPLGATYDGTGTNFAIFSEIAEAVELCLFDPSGNERKVQLHEQDAFVWHAYLPGVEPGQRYGYRVYGPYDPARGLRCNPHKLLLDPYARAVDADIDWHPSLYAYDFDNPDEMSDLDSAPHMAKGVVVNPYFDWGNDRRPDIPYHHSVIYETHVKGLTERHPDVPRDMRGTYAAIGHPAIIEHLKSLGVTAVELCLFDAAGNERRVQLHEVDAFVWHAYLPGIEPGQRYGYRVHGPYDPGRGLRCNANKLLLDPYAKAIDGDIDWHPSL